MEYCSIYCTTTTTILSLLLLLLFFPLILFSIQMYEENEKKHNQPANHISWSVGCCLVWLYIGFQQYRFLWLSKILFGFLMMRRFYLLSTIHCLLIQFSIIFFFVRSSPNFSKMFPK